MVSLFFKGLLKFLFVYFFFGYFAILALLFIFAWSVQLNTGQNYLYALEYITSFDHETIWGTIRYLMSLHLPLSDLLDQVFGTSSVSLLKGFSGLFEYLGGIIKESEPLKKQELFAKLFPSIVKISIADLFLFFYKKFKNLFGFLKGISVFLAFLIVDLLWIGAYYSFASLCLVWIEQSTATILNKYTLYWCVFLICLILRALFSALTPTALKNRIDIPTFILKFLLDTVFGIFKSIFSWLFFACFNTFTLFWDVILAFALFKCIEKLIELCELFLLGKAFPALSKESLRVLL